MNMTSLTSRQKSYFALLVFIMLPLGGMSTDIYLPSLPALSHYFGVSKGLVQTTVTSYILALGLSQLVAGPLSDAYGRKKMILAAITLQLLAVLAILFVPNVYGMIFFRFFQGMGAAFMMVPARAVISDLFEGAELKRQFNYCTISFALGPLVAPFLGGYLQQFFGWQANFIFIFIYGLLLASYILFVFKETLRIQRPFAVNHLWKNYTTILSNRAFLTGTIFASLVWGYGALFNLTGPFLIQITLHYNAITYGHIALLMGLAYLLGTIFNQVLFNYNHRKKTLIAICFILVAVVSMFSLIGLGFFNLMTLTIPTFMMIMSGGFIFPIYVSESIVIFPQLAASANACFFSFIWVIYSIFTIIAVFLKAHSLFPLSLAYSGLSLIILLVYLLRGKA